VPAVQKVFEESKDELEDVDLIELNEALLRSPFLF